MHEVNACRFSGCPVHGSCIRARRFNAVLWMHLTLRYLVLYDVERREKEQRYFRAAAGY